MPRISSSAAPSNTGVANGTPFDEVLGHLADLVVRQVIESLGLAARLVVELVEELAQLGHLGFLLQHVADALADALAGPAEVNLEHLADVHPRRHAERIQHDVARRAVGHVRHVFHRHDLRDDALVAVPAGHLVARLQAALDGQVDLDHLQHARGQLVALRQLLLLLVEGEVEAVARLLERVLDRLELVGEVLVGRADVEPVVLLDAVEVGLVDRACPWRSCSGRRWRACRSGAWRSGRTRRPRRCAAGRSGRGDSASARRR